MASDNNEDYHKLNGKSKKPKLSFISDTEMQSEFAHHDPNTARINNGSFGCSPSSVIAAQRQWQLKFLSQPDDFYFNTLKKNILESRNIIKNIVNADDVDEISIVDNATTASAIVLQQTARNFAEGRYCEEVYFLSLFFLFGNAYCEEVGRRK